MSYILEALRKADAERERGAVPDIHTQPLFASEREEAPTRPRWVVPVLGACVVLLVAALGYVLLGGRNDAATGAQVSKAAAPVAQAPSPQVAPAAPATTAPSSHSAASAPAPATTARATAAPPASSSASAARAAPAPASQSAPGPTPASAGASSPPGVASVPANPTVAASHPQRPAPAAARESAPAAAAARSASAEAPHRARSDAVAAAPAAPAERVYAPNELPDDVRRGLPSFTFGGAVYSDNAANRMLIINGQLFNEGGQPSPGVVLDQIRLKSAVFRYRGFRYEMPY